MNAVERVMRTFNGEPVDRVPTFTAGVEDRTYNDILGYPKITQEMISRNPVSNFLLDHWGPFFSKTLVLPVLNAGMDKRLKAAVEMGFDATWGLYEETFVLFDSKNMARFSGGLFNLVGDGYGSIFYQYRGPGITSREEFEAWPYFRDPDEVAHRAYKFYKKKMKKYGDKICVFGQASAYGIHESLMWTLGLERMAVWLRQEKDLVQRYVAWAEELCLKTAIAMLEAGVPVIMHSDDFCFKTGPFFNPKLIEEVFGPSYRRIIAEVHRRGGKYVLHTCGDNTVIFDMLIDWGVDGLHAYEPTSNVDTLNEKKIHGDQVVMIGGMGIDYFLTEQSSDEEVVAEVKRLIRDLGPGGRYIMAPAHSMSTIPGQKMKLMVEAVKEHGKYSVH